MKPENIETRFANRTHSYFNAFGTVVNNFYLEIGIYFVGLFNATIVAWNIYTELLVNGQPMLYAVLLGLVTLIAVEGLAVYLVTAAAKIKSGWLWFFSILFAGFFTFAHAQEMNRPGVIGQYVTLAIPFFIVIGYWARTIKLDSDAAAQQQRQINDADRTRKLQIETEDRIRKQLLEDEDRQDKKETRRKATERKHELKLVQLHAENDVKSMPNPDQNKDVKIMPNSSQNHVKHGVIDINLGKVNNQKRLSKTENLDILRQLLTEDPDRPVAQLAAALSVNRQTIYNYKKELESNGAV